MRRWLALLAVAAPAVAVTLDDLRYAAVTGGFFQTGFFRDRDQVSARVTMRLN